MTEVADKDVSTSAGATEKPAPEKPKLTVRSTASIALVVVGGLAAVGLLAAGGWIAAAAVPVAAGTGLYARHRMKNPKRVTRTTKGKLTWSLTGSQSHRALLPRGLAGKSSRASKGGKTGSRLGSGSTGRKGSLKGRAGSLLPKTTRSRARAGAGGALPKHKTSRTAAKKSRTGGPGTSSAGVRPKGTRTPKTSSKTPARPGRAPRLTGSPASRSRSGTKQAGLTSGKASTRGNRSGRRSPLSLGAGRKSSSGTASRRSGGSSPKSRGWTPKGGLFKSRGRTGNPFTNRRGGSPKTGGTRTRKNTPGGTPGHRPGRTMRQRLNPFRRTSPSGKHSTARNPWKRTRPKMKTGNPQRMKSRDRIPRRTPSRPKPYRRTHARSLWRMAFGLPVRNRKGKFRRPTPAMRRRSRRTLRLRALARLWALRKLPGRLNRWHWDRLFSKVPGPGWTPEQLAKLIKAHNPDKPPTPPTPPTGPGLAKVIPLRKEPISIMSDGPHGVIAEAFNQLAQFEPQTAGEWERFLASQQELFVGMGQAYQTLADRARSGHAFNAQTAEALQDLAAAVGSLGEMAEQSHQAFGFNQ